MNRALGPLIRRWAPTLLLLGTVAFASAAQGSDWPQWRGPNRDGIAPGAELPAVLPAALHQLWKVRVGGGQSSPIVAGDRIFVLARQGEEEVVLALSAATGEELWRHSYPVSYEPRTAAIQYGPGPKSTMLAEGSSVYSFGVRERLLSLDADSGAVRWEKTFEDAYGEPYPIWGTASSPLIEGNLLIVPVGITGSEQREDQGALIAYDKATGEEVWRLEGPPAYASPMAFTHEGVRQIVTMDDVSFFGVGATDGDPLWSLDFETAFQQNTPTTIRYDGMFILSGYQWGTAGIRVEPPKGGHGGPWKVSEVWKTTDAELYMDSPVLVGDHLYFRSNKRAGTFVCLDPATGELVWQGPGRWAAYASVIAVGKRLLVLTDEAELKVIAADPSGYQELASWEVADSTTWSHLALSGSRVYVKDEEHLAGFDLAVQVTEAEDRPAGTVVARAEKGSAGGAQDTEAVQVAVRQMLKAMANGDMDLMWTYLGEDFRSYSGADKAVFSQYLGSTAGTETKSEDMKVEWQGETARVTGVRWVTNGLDFGLEMLVDQREGKWLVTFMDFDSRRIHGQE